MKKVATLIFFFLVVVAILLRKTLFGTTTELHTGQLKVVDALITWASGLATILIFSLYKRKQQSCSP